MNDLPLRKRFFINGKPAPADPEHTKYIKPANKLLERVRKEMGGSLQQYQQRVTLEDGATLIASMRHGQAEIHIDIPRGGKQEEKKPEEESLPYMWVGIRTDWFNGGYLASVLVIEPGERGGILMGGPAGDFSQMNLYEGRAGDSIRYDGTTQPRLDIPRQIEVYRDPTFYVPSGNPVNPYVIVPAGREPLALRYPDGAEEVGGLKFSQNGLMIYDAWQVGDGMQARGFESGLWPYDPRVPVAEQAQATQGYFSTIGLWDTAIVVDPNPGVSAGPGMRDIDKRVGRAVLGAVGVGPRGVAQPGEYVLKLMIAGDPCDSPKTNPDLRTPVDITIDVCFGKPIRSQHTFVVTISHWDDLWRGMFPYGSRPWPEEFVNPEWEMGTNPHNDAWWQGALLLNPRAGTVQRVESHIPAEVFVPEDINNILYNCTGFVAVLFEAVEPWASYARGNMDGEIARLTQRIYDRDFGITYDLAELESKASGVIDPNATGLFAWNQVTAQFEVLTLQPNWEAVYAPTYAAQSMQIYPWYLGRSQ